MSDLNPPVLELTQGNTPLIVSMPHAGTHVPTDIAARLSATARALPDTDWHVDKLYDFAVDLGATVLRANYSRYVVDLNRPAEDTPMYPGAANTGVVPTVCFDGNPISAPADTPSKTETAQRIARYWQPWHDQLRLSIDRARSRFANVVLFDAHTIRSHVPRLFEGQLPDLNLGTNDGAACAAGLEHTLTCVLKDQPRFTVAVNGRFRGGYITRHYGCPETGIHAAQLELSQAAYMDQEPPYTWHPDRAVAIRPVLQALLAACLAWARQEHTRGR